MPIDYYPNSNPEELLLLLESLQRRATMGQTYMTSFSGEQQIRSFQGATPVKVEIRHVLYSLSLKDSNYENPYAARIRRVSADYSNSR
jgi:hypothetical protein